jgi:cell division septation protein DedD
LPEDQQDTEVPEIKKQSPEKQKDEPATRKKTSEIKAKAPAPKAQAKKTPPPTSVIQKKDEKKPATVSKKQASSPVYTIQAAAVKNAADADRLIAKLKKKGYPAYRAIGKVPEKGIWFRVRIGKYSSRSEAKKTLERLKKLGLKPIIVKQ